MYEKLRNTSFKNFDGITIILKTIYVLIDTTDGLLSVIFWKPHGIEVAIKTERTDEILNSSSHLKYSPMNKMIILKDTNDINNYLIELLE